MRLVCWYRQTADVSLTWGLNLTQGNPAHSGTDRKSDGQSLVTEQVNSTVVSRDIKVTVQQLRVSRLPCIPKGEAPQILNYAHRLTRCRSGSSLQTITGEFLSFLTDF